MCGIAGFAGRFHKNRAQDKLKGMLQWIEHRGPDSQGEWYTDGFAFGMRRLSIIDLPGGDQPIWGDRGCGIVFNGEIYNYRELRLRLEKKGRVFHTKSDTEVVLKLYEDKGIDCVHDLEGMFGFCIYDPELQRIFLVRDRFGVKPLYYAIDQGNLIFASETKALLRGMEDKSRLRAQSVYDFLTFRFVPNPDTMWERIESIPPGTWLEWSLKTNEKKTQPYWSLEFHSRKQSMSIDTALEEFTVLFQSAVEKRLLAADVPVGILLSGGLDSSAVAAAAARLGHKDLHSFSIGFDDPRAVNELPYAKQVSEFVGTRHHELVVDSKDFAEYFDEFTFATDEPLADLASMALYFVCKLARQHVKVVMAGEGSDELLAGYNFDMFSKRMALLRMMQYLPKKSLPYLPFASARDLAKVSLKNLPQHQRFFMTRVFSEEEKQNLWQGDRMRSSDETLDEWYDQAKSPEPLDRVQQIYCGHWLTDDLLMKADKMSMAASVELREPFLDHKLAEWAANLPIQWKTGDFVSGFSTKRILREYAKGLIPQNIIDRPKQGFPVPAYLWLQDKLKDWAHSRMESADFNGLISRKAALSTLQRATVGDLDAAHKAWSLLVLDSWMKRWL